MSDSSPGSAKVVPVGKERDGLGSGPLAGSSSRAQEPAGAQRARPCLPFPPRISASFPLCLPFPSPISVLFPFPSPISASFPLCLPFPSPISASFPPRRKFEFLPCELLCFVFQILCQPTYCASDRTEEVAETTSGTTTTNPTSSRIRKGK